MPFKTEIAPRGIIIFSNEPETPTPLNHVFAKTVWLRQRRYGISHEAACALVKGQAEYVLHPKLLKSMPEGDPQDPDNDEDQDDD